MPPGRTAPAYVPPEEEILPPAGVAGGYSSYVPPADAAPPPLPVDNAPPPASMPPPGAASGYNDLPVYQYDSPDISGYYVPPPQAGPSYNELLSQPWADPSLPGSGASAPLIPELAGGRSTPNYNFAAAEPNTLPPGAGPVLGSQATYMPPARDSGAAARPNGGFGPASSPITGGSNLLANYYDNAASTARSMKVAPKPRKWTKGDYEIAGRMLLGMGGGMMGRGAPNGMQGPYGPGVAGQQPQRQNTDGTGTGTIPEWGGFNLPFGITGDGAADLLWGSTPTVDPSLNGQSMQNEDPANPAWRPAATGPTLQDQLLSLGGQAVQGVGNVAGGIAAQNAENLEAQGILAQQEQTRADQRREAGRQAGGAPGGLSLPSFSSGLSGPGGGGSGTPSLPPLPTYTPPGPGGGISSRSTPDSMGPGGAGSPSSRPGYVRPYIPGASLPGGNTSTWPDPEPFDPTPRGTGTQTPYVRPYIPGASLPFNTFQQNGLVSGDGNFTEAGYRELRDTLGWISPDGLWTPQAAAQNAIAPESVGRPANPYEMRDPASVTPAAQQPAAPPASDAGQPLDPNAVLPVTPAEVAAVEGTGSTGTWNDSSWQPRSSRGGGSNWGGNTSSGRRSRRGSSSDFFGDDGGSWEDFLDDFDGDGDIDEKDERKAKARFMKRKKTRRGKRGGTSSGRTTVNFQTTPMREEILSTIEKSRNKK